MPLAHRAADAFFPIGLLICLSTPIPAQELRVRGKVTSGGILPDEIRVELLAPAESRKSEKAEVTSLAGTDGVFELNAPAAGMWKVRVRAPGHAAAELWIAPLIRSLDLPRLELGRGFTESGSGAWQAAAPEEPTHLGGDQRTLRGRVVDRPGRRPLAGAWVWPKGSPEDFVVTDTEGSYKLDVPHQVRLLRAGAQGHVTASRPAPPSGSVLSFALSPAVELRGAVGRVVDDVGRAVAGAEVRIVESAETQVDPVLTGPEGRFEWAALKAGTYRLVVEAAGFSRAAVPGLSVEPEQMQGDAGRVDLGTVVLVPGVALTGRVSDGTGQPIAGAEIRSSRRNDLSPLYLAAALTDEPPRTSTDAAGEFTLADLRAGERVHLVVEAPGYLPAILTSLSVPAPVGFEVVLESASRLRGRVIDTSGRPVEEAALRLGREGGRVAGPPWGTTADAEGVFEVVGLAPGPVSLTASSPGFSPTRLAGLDVPEGGVLDGVELVMSPGVVLTGQVFAEGFEPLADARVRAFVTGSQAPYQHVTTTDGEGRYRLDRLPAGQFSVVAEHRDHARATRHVEVEAGRRRLDMVLAPGLEIRGRVSNVRGEGVAGARLSLEDGAASWEGSETTSAEGGGFIFRGVVSGRYTLAVVADGYAPARHAPLEVDEAAPPEVEVELHQGATVYGAVHGLDLDEWAGLRVVAFGPGGPSSGNVDFEGRYRIPHLMAGEWTIQAELAGSGERAQDRVQVEDGEEAALDLEFGSGWTLTGSTWDGPDPVARAHVRVAGEGVSFQSETTTGPDGAFRLANLPAGRYRLEVRDFTSGLTHVEPVVVPGESHVRVELSSVRLRGVLRDDRDQSPVSGAVVRLEPASPAVGAGVLPPRREVSGADGAFFFHVQEGPWRLSVRSPGYAPAEVLVEAHSPASELALELTSVP